MTTTRTTSPRRAAAASRGRRALPATAPAMRRRASRPEVPLASSHYAAVDGMRALAILSVLVFHTGLYANGLFGVDIFFVLSGFLITLTLLREHHRTGRIRLGAFYARRAKRLLPLLVLVLGSTLWAVTALGDAAVRESFMKQGLASLLYITNWQQIDAGQSYWEGMGHLNPLGHMWSLAITEQFYLVWPLLVLAALLVGRRRTDRFAHQYSVLRPWIVTGLALAGFVIASLQPLLRFDGTNSDRMYLGTDTHVMGLLAGAAAAALNYLWLQRRSIAALRSRRGVRDGRHATAFRVLVTALSAACLCAIVLLSISATGYGEAWLYQWGFAAVSVLAAVLTLTLTSRANYLSTLFAFPPLVEIGKISYTLFLVHMPLYWLITAVDPESTPIDLLVLGVTGSLLLAGALHHLIAEPVRLRRWRTRGTIVFLSAMALTGVAVAAVPNLVPAKATAVAGSGGVSVLTMGDSISMDFASALATFEGGAVTVTDGGIAACGIAGTRKQLGANGIQLGPTDDCFPWESRWEERIAEAKPDVVLANISIDANPQKAGDAWVDLGDEEYATQYRARLDRMAEIVTASGAQLLLANSRLFNAVVAPERAAVFNEILDEFAAEHAGVRILDLQGTVCTPTGCPTTDEQDQELYIDDRVHFSLAGKKLIAPWLAAEVISAVGG
jgi:peptidoglycan/LPS O-acetylase OafA/YrhL/lysophospholipase L1-like esterase